MELTDFVYPANETNKKISELEMLAPRKKKLRRLSVQKFKNSKIRENVNSAFVIKRGLCIENDPFSAQILATTKKEGEGDSGWAFCQMRPIIPFYISPFLLLSAFIGIVKSDLASCLSSSRKYSIVASRCFSLPGGATDHGKFPS